MRNRNHRFIENLIVDCSSKGITKPIEAIEHVSGSYVVDEECAEKYDDLLTASICREEK